VNDELCRILGRSRETLLGMSVAQVTHPEDIARTLETVGRALSGEVGGAMSAIDKRYLRPDGSIVWANSRATRLPSQDGAQGNLLAVTVDLTERKAAEEAVHESEARFRQFGDASLDALWIRNADTLEWEYLSRAFDRIYGIGREAAIASRSIDFLMNLVLPEDRARVLAAIGALREGARSYEYRIRRPSDGAVRWLRTTGFRLVDPEGAVRRLGGITHDMTEEKVTADRMEVLVAELQHRTRNLIGVVRAMASRTMRASASPQEFQERFGNRLEALARVNGLLSRLEEGERVTFDALLATELEGHGLAEEIVAGGKVELRGPDGVRLPSASVQTLALALHELLTNAAKHGALRHRDGRLRIFWEMIGDVAPKLRLEWRETGISVGQGASAPPGSGYGRELIEKALPFQLGAETTYRLDEHGLLCVVELPVPRRDTGRSHG
jgi:two-component system CheB/CheR fusion protein